MTPVHDLLLNEAIKVPEYVRLFALKRGKYTPDRHVSTCKSFLSQLPALKRNLDLAYFFDGSGVFAPVRTLGACECRGNPRFSLQRFHNMLFVFHFFVTIFSPMRLWATTGVEGLTGWTKPPWGG